MFWRIHEALFKDRITEAEGIITTFGDNVQVVHGSLHQLPPSPNIVDIPSLTLTTLDDIRFKTNNTHACPWSFFQERKFSVSYWLPRLLQHNIPTVNDLGHFLPFGMLNLLSPPFFVKPNAGNKQFTGQIVFDWSGLEHLKIEQETMCFISPVKRLCEVEWRFWIVDKKVVTFSPYTWDENIDVSLLNLPQEAAELAARVAETILDIDVTFVVDIVYVEDDNEYQVNEINSTTTSGVYNADLKALFGSLRILAQQEWNAAYATE